ncbi:hypothetical protein EDB84DRAFT_1436422 [Lactarius hengduanensis]|nr:hypothetical protein EDB84DRAFT_1436422 [Lactarius hengduanensis]
MPKKKHQSRLRNIERAQVRRAQKIEESKPVNRTRLPSENSEATEIEVDKPESYPEIVELSAADFLSPAPRNAPRQAPAPEGSKKRVHASHHNQRSERTIRRHKKARRDLEAQGFFSLPEFFKRKAESARQEEPSGTEAIQTETRDLEDSEDKGITDKDSDMHEAEVAKVAEGASNADGGAVSVNVLEVGDEAESANDKDEAAGSLRSAKGATMTIRLEEEEEEETDAEAEAEDEARKTTGGAMSMHGDLSDSEQLGSRWGPSRTVRYESEESSSVLQWRLERT